MFRHRRIKLGPCRDARGLGSRSPGCAEPAQEPVRPERW
jgi:hypothetical protein